MLNNFYLHTFVSLINLKINSGMKTKNKFSKTVQTLMVVAALTFSCNMNAWSFRSYWPWNSTSTTSTTISSARASASASSSGGTSTSTSTSGNASASASASTGGTKSVPLDGGLSILVLGAAAFGVRKLRGNNNDKA